MEKKIKIGKKFWNEDRYMVAYVEDFEDEIIQQQLRQKNNDIMKECVIDAKLIVTRAEIRDIYRLAIALFEQRAIKSFTYYSAFIDEKIRKIRVLKSVNEKRGVKMNF